MNAPCRRGARSRFSPQLHPSASTPPQLSSPPPPPPPPSKRKGKCGSASKDDGPFGFVALAAAQSPSPPPVHRAGAPLRAHHARSVPQHCCAHPHSTLWGWKQGGHPPQSIVWEAVPSPVNSTGRGALPSRQYGESENRATTPPSQQYGNQCSPQSTVWGWKQGDD
eukprot:COSAG02_NODE_7289_length_3083_cov_3.512399_1_plen_165_part_10